MKDFNHSHQLQLAKVIRYYIQTFIFFISGGIYDSWHKGIQLFGLEKKNHEDLNLKMRKLMILHNPFHFYFPCKNLREISN